MKLSLAQLNGLQSHERDAQRKGRKGGVHDVQRSSSEQIVLTCKECQEKLVVLGPEKDWRSRRPVFQCECGQKLTLDGRTAEEVLAAS